MLVGARRGRASAGSPHEVSLGHEVRLVDVLEGIGLLAHCRRQRFEPHRASRELVDQGVEDLAIHGIEPRSIYLEAQQRPIRRFPRDRAVAFDLREIAHPPQQSIGNARRASRPPRDLLRAALVDANAELSRRPPDDLLQVARGVVVEAADDATGAALRTGAESPAGGRAYDLE